MINKCWDMIHDLVRGKCTFSFGILLLFRVFVFLFFFTFKLKHRGRDMVKYGSGELYCACTVHLFFEIGVQFLLTLSN